MATSLLDSKRVDLSARWAVENYDEETKAKLEEIIELLVAAGYFRARIKSLDPFDKIMGGLSWTITIAGEADHLDMDLRFHDSLSIGDKISLTEKIVRVLHRMKCPHRLEPHQIQGMDTAQIFPVIQWLVKKSMENRVRYQEHMKRLALNQFNNQYNIASGDTIVSHVDNESSSAQVITESKPIPAPRIKSVQRQHAMIEDVERLKKLESELKQELDSLKQDETISEDGYEERSSKIKLQLKEEIEELQREKTSLKQSAKAEKARLESMIDKQRSGGLSEDSLVPDKERLNKIRTVLASKNQMIARYERKLDDIPSRVELSQYQKRFSELYAAMAVKYKEEKKWVCVYNCLQDRRAYLEKELKLLNSIHESYLTITNNSMKNEFAAQLETIVEGVKKSAGQVADRLEDEKRKKDSMLAQLNTLSHLSRQYYKYVKLFAEVRILALTLALSLFPDF